MPWLTMLRIQRYPCLKAAALSLLAGIAGLVVNGETEGAASCSLLSESLPQETKKIKKTNAATGYKYFIIVLLLIT